ncbi:MAG: putative PEP-binding protein, partial [Pseudomonadota bacterium]
ELPAIAYEALARGSSAQAAWQTALEAEIADYESASFPYFRARASDLRDLRDRVLEALFGTANEPIPPGAIVVADDLAPSRFLAADWDGGGIVLRRGSATSHVAILARSKGVPMLVGVDTERLNGHREALLDAEEGVLILDPDARERGEFERRRAAHAARLAEEAVHLAREATTANGERVRVLINIGGPEDLAAIDPAHTDGIGLMRTEFMFHGRERLPDEDEQYRAYCRVVEWAQGRPVTIRTLDAGGDKPVAGLTLEGESNPFLGVRGVRLSLRRPEVFAAQLRALARAAIVGPLKIMVPMVTTPEEFARCRALLVHAVAELDAKGVPARRPPLGMMVEVPVAALEIERFDADFYSIGSNDLIQYLNAASRDAPELAALGRPSSGLWRLIRAVCEHGRRSRREVTLCGDLASDPHAAAALLECGLRALSVTPASIAAVKAAVARHETRA